MHGMRTYTGGFTLVELSIVMIIVGLVVGGIVGGRSLIHASELQSIVGNYKAYDNAVSQFREKYTALPGDMVEAENFWGADAGCPTPAYNTSPKVVTCNGDGNGLINDAGATVNERWAFWQHLTNAQMIKGSFTGVGVGGKTYNAGVNVPATELSGVGFTVTDSSLPNAAPLNSQAYSGHKLAIVSTTDDTRPYWAVTTDDAYAIDNKADDGSPIAGIVRAPAETVAVDSPVCEFDADNVAYNTASGDSRKCMLYFKLGGG